MVSKDLAQKKEEIRVHQKHCQEQEAILKERVVYIKAFNAKFKDEYDACQKKLQYQIAYQLDYLDKGYSGEGNKEIVFIVVVYCIFRSGQLEDIHGIA